RGARRRNDAASVYRRRADRRQRRSGTVPGTGRLGRTLALADNPLSKLPIVHPVNVDRPFRKRQEYRRRLYADRAGQEADERPDLQQPCLVEQEGDQSERPDQALGLLAELPAAVEDRRASIGFRA